LSIKQHWTAFWKERTPESEIVMRDFYGGRDWILKHTPRFGRVVEAGCGLGRYVFYLRMLGIDVEGVDFEQDTLERVKAWAQSRKFAGGFRLEDVTRLTYESDSISGYISLGVVEHFVEGPGRAIREARRVLRPGGVAIITTPSVSLSVLYLRALKRVKDLIKFCIGRPVRKEEFFQYWYRPGRLAAFVREAGLDVVLHGGGDLLYSMWELGLVPKNSLFFRLVTRLERTPLSWLGAQSFTVSVKPGPVMYCFLCGEQNVTRWQRDLHYIPICPGCAGTDLAEFYRPGRRPVFHAPWTFCESQAPPARASCKYCGREFLTDGLFEDFGFSVPVCQNCLKRPEVNLELSNRFLRPVWRLDTG
jgi:SAM-dependent methyltransferase